MLYAVRTENVKLNTHATANSTVISFAKAQVSHISKCEYCEWLWFSSRLVSFE